jgi:hypothetical protein
LVLLFLYHRLYQTTQRQLDSLKTYDYATLERLTLEREGVTRELCEMIEEVTGEQGGDSLSEPVRRNQRPQTQDHRAGQAMSAKGRLTPTPSAFFRNLNAIFY